MKSVLSIFCFIWLTQHTCSSQVHEFSFGVGSHSYDAGQSIEVDQNGNIYVVGHFVSTVDFDPSGATANVTSNGNTDGFIAKYDPSGNHLWSHGIGGNASADYAFSTALDGQGNIYVCGTFQGFADFDHSAGVSMHNSNGGYDIFVLKYDPNGNLLWANSMGGTGTDRGHDMAIDNAGNVYVIGDFEIQVDFDPGPNTAYGNALGLSDVFVAKYDSNGNYIRAFDIGGIHDEGGASIGLDDEANIYITGFFGDAANFNPAGGPLGGGHFINTLNKDIYLAKYDSTGAFQWAHGLGGGTTHGSNCEGFDLEVSGNGDVFLTGLFWGTIDLDPSASTANLTPVGNGDAFVARYSKDGDYVWGKSIGGTLETYSRGIAIDNHDNCYITGYFRTNTDFDPGSGIASLSSQDGQDAFVACLSSHGNYRWAFRMGGNGLAESGYGIHVPNDTSLYVVGSYGDSALFDYPNITDSLFGHDQFTTDIFVAKYAIVDTTDYTHIRENISGSKLLIYPNPSLGVFTVLNKEIKKPMPIQLFDSQGRQVWNGKLYPKTNCNINLQHSKKGGYYLKAGEQVHKIILN